MKRILVTYATMAGSTREVAQSIAEEIARGGAQVDVFPLQEVGPIEAYDGVVVGAPMILGWHRAALSFLRRNRKALQHVPWAVFVVAVSLTRSAETSLAGVPVELDENLPKSPVREGHLTLGERYSTLSNYLRPIFAAAGQARPLSVGVFAGRLEYGRLKWWAVLFAMLIIRARAGDRRNWPAIRAWAGQLAVRFDPSVG